MTPNSWKSFATFGEYLKSLSDHFGPIPCLTELRTGRSLSYQETEVLSRQAGAELLDQGLRPGDRFGMVTRNQIDFFIWYLAALRTGIWIVPIVFDSPASEINRLIRHFNLRGLILSPNWADSADFKNDSLAFVWKLPKKGPAQQRNVIESPMWNAGSLYSSSGTTGEPKGIPQSAGNLLSAAEALVDCYQLGAHPKFLGVLPCYHTALATYGFWPCLMSGGEFILIEKFSLTSFWDDVAASRASYVSVVPTILQLLLNRGNKPAPHQLAHLKFLGSGSAPLSPELHKNFEEHFSVPVANQYGLSETAPTHFNPPHSGKFGAIGWPMKSCTTTLGESGELIIDGPSVFAGYWNPAGNTPIIPRTTGFHTGDLGTCDQDGCYTLRGRVKEMISRGGSKIYPAEIDRVLMEFQQGPFKVLDAATFGVADPIYGEEVAACIVVDQTDTHLIQRMIEHCQKALPSWKCPKKIYLMDQIPRTPSGKILRRLLQTQFQPSIELGALT